MNISEIKKQIILPDKVLSLLIEYNKAKELYSKNKDFEYMLKLIKREVQFQLESMRIDLKFD